MQCVKAGKNVFNLIFLRYFGHCFCKNAYRLLTLATTPALPGWTNSEWAETGMLRVCCFLYFFVFFFERESAVEQSARKVWEGESALAFIYPRHNLNKAWESFPWTPLQEYENQSNSFFTKLVLQWENYVLISDFLIPRALISLRAQKLKFRSFIFPQIHNGKAACLSKSR